MIQFVIKSWIKGRAVYMTHPRNENYSQETMFKNIYGIDSAMMFESEEDAFTFLSQRFKYNYWGGKFQIEEVIISR